MATLWWVGGYGPDMDGGAAGIGMLRDRGDGTLENLEAVAEAASPSFLARKGDHVYAVAEGESTVSSFRRTNGRLELDGTAPSGGALPCHILVRDDDVIVSNYGDGALGVVSLRPDGSVGELIESIAGDGNGPRKEQDGPHAHSSVEAQPGVLLSVDLGADRIHIHQADGSKLTRTGSFSFPPGTGPRDISRHPNGSFVVLSELSHELFVFEWTGEDLELASSVAVPGAQEGDNGSGISFSSNGRYIYTALRGSSQLAVFEVDTIGNGVSPVRALSTEGDWPRHHTVDGDFLHVAHQLSNSVASFRLGADGIPQYLGSTATPSPTYLLTAD